LILKYTPAKIKNMPTCEYCGKSFSKQSTLDIHMCEPKRRWQQKDNKVHVLAFEIFRRFYEINYPTQKEKTFHDFVNSQYYRAFLKTSEFITANTPIEIGAFIDWLCTSKIRIDSWPKQQTINTYLKHIVKTEPVPQALNRTIKQMGEWATEENARLEDFFKYINLNRVTQMIANGKISPWIILNSETGKDMISIMHDDQIKIIYEMIDPEYWKRTFKKREEDLDFVKQTLTEAGIE
tara:strand:- start:917 stop:1627 length:711 start_codon:yes stop_codon:yes gene_type:complete